MFERNMRECPILMGGPIVEAPLNDTRAHFLGDLHRPCLNIDPECAAARGGLVLGDNAYLFGNLMSDSPAAKAMRAFHQRIV